MKEHLNTFGVVVASALAGIAIYLLLIQNAVLKPLCTVENPVYLDSVQIASDLPTGAKAPGKK